MVNIWKSSSKEKILLTTPVTLMKSDVAWKGSGGVEVGSKVACRCAVTAGSKSSLNSTPTVRVASWMCGRVWAEPKLTLRSIKIPIPQKTRRATETLAACPLSIVSWTLGKIGPKRNRVEKNQSAWILMSHRYFTPVKSYLLDRSALIESPTQPKHGHLKRIVNAK